MTQRARSLPPSVSSDQNASRADGEKPTTPSTSNTTPTSRWLHPSLAIKISTALALFAIGGVGCLARTVVGTTNDGGGGSGTTSVSTSSTTVTSGVTVSSSSGPAPTPSAVALMTSELPPNALPCGFNPCTPPADMLFVEIAGLGNNSCAMPIPGLNTSTNDWIRQIGIPIQYQQVGTYSMGDMAIYLSGGENIAAPSGTGAATSSGGMGAGGGTLEVVSVDKTSIHIRLQGTALNNPSEDGDFIAPRCTPLP